jgi:hypothetical protein
MSTSILSPASPSATAILESPFKSAPAKTAGSSNNGRSKRRKTAAGGGGGAAAASSPSCGENATFQTVRSIRGHTPTEGMEDITNTTLSPIGDNSPSAMLGGYGARRHRPNGLLNVSGLSCANGSKVGGGGGDSSDFADQGCADDRCDKP